jgi:Flp pilus assembly protein TadD
MLWRMTRARLLARSGALSEADALSEEAVRIAARTDWLVDHGDTLMVRGEVLRACGRDEDARLAMRRACELYDRKGHVVAARRARAVVDGQPRRRGHTAPRRSE